MICLQFANKLVFQTKPSIRRMWSQTNLCSQYQLTNLNADNSVIKKWKQPRNLTQSTLHLGHPYSHRTKISIFQLPILFHIKWIWRKSVNIYVGKLVTAGQTPVVPSGRNCSDRKIVFWGLLWASVFGGWEFFPFYFGFADGMVQNIGNSTKWPNVNISIHTYVHIQIYHTYIHIYIYIYN